MAKTKQYGKAGPATEPDNTKVAPVSSGDDTLDAELAALDKRRKNGDFKKLIEQVQSEYELSWAFMKPKFDEWMLRLKLYNNQKRDKEAIGDPLLFTIHQTILAALYGDRLMAAFEARESGDEETAENINALADFDYEEMGKDEVDYYWDWDTLFFGRGLVLLFEFDRKIKAPIPENVDALTFLRDPRARSVNGDRKGRGGLRFWGRPIRLTKDEMEKAGVYFNFGNLKATGFDIKNPLDQAIQARDEAAGHDNSANRQRSLVGDNADYRLLEWWTTWQGKKCIVTLADDRKKIVRYTELEEETWPLVDRALFPTSQDWDGVSIPDLVEDKQRARSVLQNLGLKSAKANVHPMYLYDSLRVKNRADLNFGFNKFIPVDGNPTGAVQIMPKDGLKQEVQYIMDLLDFSAQKATATPDMQQGSQSKDKRTLGELELVDSKVDKRYSLSARIFGWSEKRFWKRYYSLYKKHFAADIDEKVVRIVGALGSTWRPLRRENIIANTDPDVRVESREVSEAKRFNELRVFQTVLQAIAQDPNANLRWGEKRFAKLAGLAKDEIDQLMPPVIEEIRAEEENKLIEQDELVQVQAADDHIIHLEVHNKASDTPAKMAHMNAHKKAMVLQRTRPDLFAGLPPSAANPRAGAGIDQNSLGRPSPEKGGPTRSAPSPMQ